MNRFAQMALVAVFFATPGSAQHAQTTIQPETVAWSPGPPNFPAGAEVAVISGDPSKSEPYVVRLRVPAGYRFAPHTHPGDENITVLSGSFNVGMGDKFDDTKGVKVRAGGFTVVHKNMPHYAWFTEPSVLQAHGVGPFTMEYVNPADDPSKK